ncbi:hypothetical protein P8452_35968 [Trifolium repens]|nr:hypothetical protein P8452_35968 [Trifolium repens]
MKRNRKPFVFPLLSAVLRNNNSTITFTHKLRSILLQTSLTFSPNPSPVTASRSPLCDTCSLFLKRFLVLV